MANYTLKIDSICTGGEHITLQLYKDALVVLIRQAIKSAGATTNAKRKAAIEGMVITL